MIPTQAIATIVACSVVAVVGIIVTLTKVLKPTHVFNGETREILTVLRDIRDRLVAQGFEASKIYDCASRVEQSQSALHRRMDQLTGARE